MTQLVLIECMNNAGPVSTLVVYDTWNVCEHARIVACDKNRWAVRFPTANGGWSLPTSSDIFDGPLAAFEAIKTWEAEAWEAAD